MIMARPIIEPFKIKVVEPIKFTSINERETILTEAGYNLFQIKSEQVLIDLLTDSGTSAMSADQWAGIMQGDEAYAGSRSFYRLEERIKHLTGYRYIIPTHQGRAAEKILFSVLGGKGKSIPNNSHFDTTRANIEYSGAEALDFLGEVGKDPSAHHPFKGNMDIAALSQWLDQNAQNVPCCMLTITNNSGGGQPVSMENIRAVSQLCRSKNIPFFLDACRFAENAYFIKLREPEYANRSVESIAQEMFSYADGCTMSAKKDGLVNIGGFLALNDERLAASCRNVLIITEGFSTYGGLAGRDLEAIAQGLKEVVEEDYLHYRLIVTRYVHEKLTEQGIPLMNPPGGHAIYIDAKRFCDHIPPERFPGQAVACGLYLQDGIRTVEIGSLMFGKTPNGDFVPPPMELVRLAMPRRVYTQSHMDYVIESVIDLYQKRHSLRGFVIESEPPFLRHFTARLKPE